MSDSGDEIMGGYYVAGLSDFKIIYISAGYWLVVFFCQFL